MQHTSAFHRLAKRTASAAGRPVTFILSVMVVLAWLMTGPIFHFSDTWQLVINTGTTIVTFLMVFLIQNTQNRDTEAIQLKLDELIRCTQGAHNALLDIEQLTERDLDLVRSGYEHLAEDARLALQGGGEDVGTPEVGSPRSDR
jgi:low affinity Fe/Cu permease